MPSRKGLKSLVESNPEFSNQALENAINDLRIGWVSTSFDLDAAITNNTVLTTSQKNDAKETINNHAHLNIGRYLSDLIRHSNTILDGTVVPLDDADNATPPTFLDILTSVGALQGLIPELLGVPASEKKRGVNDHFGSLNNIFLETTDSSQPVFTTLKNAITFINNGDLATETALQTAYTNMKNFVDGVAADSTDFQQTLDTFATAVATAHTNFHNALNSEPYLTQRNTLVTDRDEINTQVSLEISNLVSLDSFTDNLNDYNAYTSLAEDSDLRDLMQRTSQNSNWISYFRDYEENEEAVNPLYTTDTDSAKDPVIQQVLASRGLPDVLDFLDLDAVANKARKDSRIDSTNFDFLDVDGVIEQSCIQLNLPLFGTIYNKSERLLNNLNEQDRNIIAKELDANEDANTLS